MGGGGGGGGGQGPGPPLENHKYIVFLAILVRIALKSQPYLATFLLGTALSAMIKTILILYLTLSLPNVTVVEFTVYCQRRL